VDGLVWVVAAAVSLGVAEAVAQSVDFGVYGLRVGSLDSSTDGGVFGALGLVSTAAAAVACLLLAARRQKATSCRLAALAITAILALELGEPPHAAALAAPAGVAAVLILWRLGEEDAAVRRVLRAGAIVLAASYLVHLVGASLLSHFGYAENTWPYQAKVIVKHGGELVGWTLVAGGLGVAWWRRGRRAASASRRPPAVAPRVVPRI
jgi:hypothetical protein